MLGSINVAPSMVSSTPKDATGGIQTALSVEIPLMLLAVSTVGLRVYSRLAIKKRLAADDVLIKFGTSAAIARTVISCMSAADIGGYSRQGPDRTSEIPFYQHVFERRIAYIVAVTFTRFSILAYYLRIFPPQLTSLRRCTNILIFLTLAHFIEVLTVLIIFCKDIAQLWTSHWSDFTGSQCFSSAVYSYSAAIGDSIVDSLIFTLPIPYVWRLSKIRTRQRFGLVLVFGLGFIVCVVSLLQIPFIKRRERNMRYFGSAVNMLIAVQISFAIIAASLPDLRALIARKFPNFSPLNHRSLVTDAGRVPDDGRRVQVGDHDLEAGSSVESTMEGRGAAFEGKRVLQKPDWLRHSIPGSLMSTTATQTELRRSSIENMSHQSRLPKGTEQSDALNVPSVE